MAAERIPTFEFRMGLPRLLRPARMSRSVHGAVVVALLVVVWAVVYAAGGSRTALPHLFYFPIVWAAVTLGVPGAVGAGVLAALLAGPLLPLDTQTGTAQSLANWVARGVLLVGVGAFTGAVIAAYRRSVADSLAAHIGREVELAASDDPPRLIPSVAGQLRETIDNRRFHPVYQPIYSLTDGQLLAVEALTRFEGKPPEPPDTWFAHAGLAGMEAELDLAAAGAALESAHRVLPAGIALHLNVAPTSLRDARMLELLTSYPDLDLVVEVTEHAVIDSYQRLEHYCRRLREHGIKLAVDDVGAGISSLRHVVKLTPDIIKLDMSLSQNVRDDPVQYALASALVQFTFQIDAQLVVEGIEDTGDLAAWTRLGAHAAQGYLLGRPGPLADVLEVRHSPTDVRAARH